MSARLTERAGSSEYFLGGAVVYSNEAKVSLAGVDPALIERFGAVSNEVAEALALARLSGSGPMSGSGSPGSPGPAAAPRRSRSGPVCFSVVRTRDGARLTRRLRLPGSRSDVRERSTTVAMHLLRRLSARAEAGDVRLVRGRGAERRRRAP